MGTGQKINKRTFYKEKFLLFKEYADRYPDKELFPLFNEWADSNEIYGIERHEIWRRARKLGPIKTITIVEGSEEWIRVQAALDILLEADLKGLHELMEKKGLIPGEKNHGKSRRNFRN